MVGRAALMLPWTRNHRRRFALRDTRVEGMALGMARPCHPSIDDHPVRFSSTTLIPSDPLFTFSYSRFEHGVSTV